MRKIIIILASCLVLLLLGYTGYRSYSVWKQSHGIAMARACFSKGDIRSGVLALQQVLKTNPRNIEANRMNAALLEAQHIPNALLWRERVLDLNPGSFDDRMALVEAALNAKDYILATNTLAGVAENDKNTVIYQNIAGMLAVAEGQLDQGSDHFNQAIRLDPSNPLPRMNLAVLQLHRTNALDVAEARITLQRMILNSTNSGIRTLARRELIGDALNNKNFSAAISLARDLANQTNSMLQDKFLLLKVLALSKSPDFGPALAIYQNEASTNVPEAFNLATWQMINVSVPVTLDWLRKLPPQSKTNVMVEERTATCLLLLNDWKGLQSFVQQQDWNDSSQPLGNLEFKRHALVARSLRGQGLDEASVAEWAVAIRSVNDTKYQVAQKYAFQQLFELAEAWKWHTEAEEVLWTVIKQFPEERWAVPVLRVALIEWHRTKSLMQLFDIMVRRSPDDFDAKNDLAATALLLGAQEYKPYELAKQAYEKDPKNPSYASTYAFSLYLQHKYPEALKAMQELTADELRSPSIAAYYALVLEANGKKADAQTYFNVSSKAQLLPEEQALFDEAKARL